MPGTRGLAHDVPHSLLIIEGASILRSRHVVGEASGSPSPVVTVTLRCGRFCTLVATQLPAHPSSGFVGGPCAATHAVFLPLETGASNACARSACPQHRARPLDCKRNIMHRCAYSLQLLCMPMQPSTAYHTLVTALGLARSALELQYLCRCLKS